MTTTNIVNEASVTIEIPAGTYDWCITNPTDGDRMWIAGNGRADDYVFEAGKAYEFIVYYAGSGDDVYLNQEAGEWTVINETTENPYLITGLQPNTFYEIQVQGICDQGYLSEWSEEGLGVQTLEAPVVTELDQTYAISAGWNWMSSYLECSDELFTALKEGIAANNTSAVIKNMDGSTMLQTIEQTPRWNGSMSFVNESMYMLKVANATVVTLTAAPANPVDHPITLNPGWTWIGFPFNKVEI